MPWTQKHFIWECGSRPSMDILLKRGFRKPWIYHCSFRICQTVLSICLACYHLLQACLFMTVVEGDDLTTHGEKLQAFHWYHKAFSLKKKQAFLQGLNYVHQLWIAQAGALKWRQVIAFNSQLTRALWCWLLMLHAIGCECKTDHCACEMCPKPWVQRTNDWTQTVAIIATELRKWSPSQWCEW